jgi:hypothetical protein
MPLKNQHIAEQLFSVGSAILAIAIIAYIYWSVFRRFGPNSRCVKVTSYKFDDGTVIMQVAPSRDMTFYDIKKYVENRSYIPATLADLQMLERRKSILPQHSRLLGYERGVIYALDIDYDPHASYSKKTQIIEVQDAGSFEDCRVLIKKLVAVKSDAKEKFQAAA